MAFKDRLKTLKVPSISRTEAAVPEPTETQTALNQTEIIVPETSDVSSTQDFEEQGVESLADEKLKKSFLNTSKGRFSNLSSNLTSRAKSSSQALRERSPELKTKLREHSDSIKLKASEINLRGLSGSLSTQLRTAAEFSTSKVSDLTTRALHLDKDAEQIVDEIKHRSPPELDNVEDIISHCKGESVKLILTSFALHDATMGKYDEKLADNFSNLSESYSAFDERVSGVRNHANFKKMMETKKEYKASSTLMQDEYQSSRYMDADHGVHIDHVIPTKQIFDNVLLKASTNDEQLVDVMNNDENLAFTFSSLNTSKNDNDFATYLRERSTPHPTNDDLVVVIIAGKEVTVNEKEAIAKYEEAQASYKQLKMDALKDMGINIVSAGGMMAVKQLTGHVIYETYDVFFDEIGSFHGTDLPFETEAYSNYFSERKDIFAEKLQSRIKERKIMERAREIGIDSFLSGIIATIPQLMISLIIKLPAMVMGVIRECTNGVIKSLRVLLSKVEDKVGKIMTILSATIGAVLGLYLMRLVSNGLSVIPLLNVFSNELSTIFTSSIVGLVSLFGIYYFNKNKHKINFSFSFPKKARGDQSEELDDAQPQA